MRPQNFSEEENGIMVKNVEIPILNFNSNKKKFLQKMNSHDIEVIVHIL